VDDHRQTKLPLDLDRIILAHVVDLHDCLNHAGGQIAAGPLERFAGVLGRQHHHDHRRIRHGNHSSQWHVNWLRPATCPERIGEMARRTVSPEYCTRLARAQPVKLLNGGVAA